MRSCALSTHVSSESLWVILCVFIFGLQLVLPLMPGVRESTLVWACTCIYVVFSAVAGLPHILSVSEDVLVNLDPHVCSLDTVLSLDSFLVVLNPHSSLWLSQLSVLSLNNYFLENIYLLCCQNTQLHTFLKIFSSPCSEWPVIVFKGKLLILRKRDWRKQPNRLREGMLCIPATPCSVCIVCVTLMNYGWGYRSLSSALLHWPT